MEAVSRVAAGLTDTDRRVFCLLPYAQALLDHDLRWSGALNLPYMAARNV